MTKIAHQPRRGLRRGLRWGAAAAVVLALTACGVAEDPLQDPVEEMPAEAIAVGWVHPEQELIAEAYAAALEADGGSTEVRRYPTREEAIVALQAGDVDLLPEYSGELVLFFSQGNPAAADVAASVDFLTETLAPEVTVLTPAAAGSRYVYAVPPAVTEQYHLVSLETAAEYLDGRTLGGPADLADATYGVAGFEGMYGISLEFSEVSDPDELLDGLIAGDVGVAAFRSTDPRIDQVVMLDDPQQMVPGNAVIALASEGANDSAVSETVNEVQGALDEEGLLALTGDTERPAAEVARDWVAEQGLD